MLNSAPAGLLPAEAAARRELYGRNELRAVSLASLGQRLLLQLSHPITILLLAAGLVALLGGKPGSAAVVWAVVVVHEAFAFWQGYRTDLVLLTANPFEDLEALRRPLKVIKSGQVVNT